MVVVVGVGVVVGVVVVRGEYLVILAALFICKCEVPSWLNVKV